MSGILTDSLQELTGFWKVINTHQGTKFPWLQPSFSMLVQHVDFVFNIAKKDILAMLPLHFNRADNNYRRKYQSFNPANSSGRTIVASA